MQGLLSFARIRKEEAVTTREEAVSLLRRYRRDVYRSRPKRELFTMKQYDAVVYTCVYGRYLVDELIRRIRCTDEPPIHVVYDLYSALDDVLSESDDDHFETHSFASLLENECGDILRYLKHMEAEKQNEEHGKLEKRRGGGSERAEAQSAGDPDRGGHRGNDNDHRAGGTGNAGGHAPHGA